MLLFHPWIRSWFRLALKGCWCHNTIHWTFQRLALRARHRGKIRTYCDGRKNQNNPLQHVLPLPLCLALKLKGWMNSIKVYRHVKWGLILKLLWWAFSWHPWIQGTIELDSILSLFKCAVTCQQVTGASQHTCDNFYCSALGFHTKIAKALEGRFLCNFNSDFPNSLPLGFNHVFWPVV